MASNNVDQTPTQEPPLVVGTYHFYRDEVTRVKLPGDVVMRFAETVHDVSAGVCALMEILEKDHGLAVSAQDLDPGENAPPRLLSPFHVEALSRLVRASTFQLMDKADSLMLWAFEHHTPQGQRERREHAAFVARDGADSAKEASHV